MSWIKDSPSYTITQLTDLVPYQDKIRDNSKVKAAILAATTKAAALNIVEGYFHIKIDSAVLAQMANPAAVQRAGLRRDIWGILLS
jgi:hypothetical protein